MLRLLLLISASFIITGCMQLSPFYNVMNSPRSRKAEEPQVGEVARLRGIGEMFVNPYNCGIADKLEDGTLAASTKLMGGVFVAAGDFFTHSGYKGRSIGMPEMEKPTDQVWGEMFIRASEPIEIAITYTTGRTYNYEEVCTLSGSFQPERGRDYEAHTQLIGKMCYLSIFDITGGERIAINPSAQRLPCPK